MSERKSSIRDYFQDGQSLRKKSISTTMNITSTRNRPEMLSLFAITNKQLEKKEEQIIHPTSNDTYNFHLINYQIQSPPPSPPPSSELQNNNHPILPKLTPRVNMNTS